VQFHANGVIYDLPIKNEFQTGVITRGLSKIASLFIFCGVEN
jgi:hypothetical protein